MALRVAFTEIYRGGVVLAGWMTSLMMVAIRSEARRRAMSYETVVRELLRTEDDFLEGLNTLAEVRQARAVAKR